MLSAISIAGLTVSELIMIITFISGIATVVIRWGLINPLKGSLDLLNDTVTELRGELKESKEDRGNIHGELNDHDKKIALLQQEDKAIWRVVQMHTDGKSKEGDKR